jgi:hypothetical protein
MTWFHAGRFWLDGRYAVKKSEAIVFQTHSLSAIRDLIFITQLPLGWENDEDLRKPRRGIVSLGEISEV